MANREAVYAQLTEKDDQSTECCSRYAQTTRCYMGIGAACVLCCGIFLIVWNELKYKGLGNRYKGLLGLSIGLMFFGFILGVLVMVQWWNKRKLLMKKVRIAIISESIAQQGGLPDETEIFSI